MEPQGMQETTTLLNFCRQAYSQIQLHQLALLRNASLEFDTIHIRVYSNVSFLNLPEKHSQIGFVFVLADGNDKNNLSDWYRSCASRWPASTEEAKLLSLDIALNRLQNQRKIVFQLLQKEVPVVVSIDYQTLWQNLMNDTAPSLPEMMYRCRERIIFEVVNSVCLIESKCNIADAMSKKGIQSLSFASFEIKRERSSLQTSFYASPQSIPTHYFYTHKQCFHAKRP